MPRSRIGRHAPAARLGRSAVRHMPAGFEPTVATAGAIVPGVDEQQPRPAEPTTPDDAITTGPPRTRRQPGEPHPYVEERRPPNLWLLAVMTAIALVVALLVMALTLL